MTSARWLGFSFAGVIAAAMFAACSSSTQTSPGPGGGNGSGGATSSSTTVSSSSGGLPEAGPPVCKGTYSTVPMGTCDPFQQDCAPGFTCRPVKSGADYKTQCVAATGLKTASELCNAESECAEGLFCIGGKCSPVCCRESAEPCNGAICDYSVTWGSHQMYFCHFAPKCTLLTPNACDDGLDCHIEDATQGLATCGEPSGNLAPDLGPCSYLNDCGDMQQCYSTITTSAGTCHYYCWLDAAPGTKVGLGGCPDHQQCLSSYSGKKINYGVPGLGLCFPDGTAPDAGDEGGGGAGGGASSSSSSTSSSSSSSSSASSSSSSSGVSSSSSSSGTSSSSSTSSGGADGGLP